MGRRRSPVATALAVTFLVLGAPSCAAILGVDDYSDASVELCDLLGRCYKGFKECLPTVQKALDTATAAQKASWLAYFSDNRCLADCKSAYRCLDAQPLCKKAGARCTRDEGCCGFSKSLAACDEKEKRCCGAKGAVCKSDDDCCGDAGRCSDETKTCGGVVCSPADTPCTYNFECCSSLCGPTGTCLPCSPDGFSCAAPEECCSGFCDPQTGACGASVCGGVGAPCLDGGCCPGLSCFQEAPVPTCTDCPGLPNDAPCTGPDQCCSQYCHPAGFCTDKAACVDDGFPCASDIECCSGACPAGLCGCAPDGFPCTDPGQCCSFACNGGFCGGSPCKSDGDFCNLPEECCSQQCNGGLCGSGGCGGTSACDHDICTQGGVLDPNCDCPQPPCTVDTACVKIICDSDSYCCCTSWDGVCVGEATSLCGITCF